MEAPQKVALCELRWFIKQGHQLAIIIRLDVYYYYRVLSPIRTYI